MICRTCYQPLTEKSDEKWFIDKLDGSNWTTWKFQIKNLLLAKDLWKYCDGSATLDEGASAADRTKYQKEAQKTFSNIVMTVSSSQFYLITSCEKPKEAWDALKNLFKRDTLAKNCF